MPFPNCIHDHDEHQEIVGKTTYLNTYLDVPEDDDFDAYSDHWNSEDYEDSEAEMWQREFEGILHNA